LDPTYGAKAAAGLLDMVRRGAFSRSDTVCFWHTGGTGWGPSAGNGWSLARHPPPLRAPGGAGPGGPPRHPARGGSALSPGVGADPGGGWPGVALRHPARAAVGWALGVPQRRGEPRRGARGRRPAGEPARRALLGRARASGCPVPISRVPLGAAAQRAERLRRARSLARRRKLVGALTTASPDRS